MAKVLVTGGAGFIGSHLVEALLRARHQVVVVDDLSSGRRAFVPAAATFHKLDVRSAKLGALVARLKPAYVCHLAAQPSVVRSQADAAHDASINIVGGLNLLQAVRSLNIRKFLLVSSAAVYGDPATVPTAETDSLDPCSPYALSKHTMERYLEYYAREQAMPVVTVRPANVYGPRQGVGGEGGVVGVFARAILKHNPLTIHGRGDQTRDYVYVGDVAAGLAAALESGSGAYNLSCGRDISVRELVIKFGEVLGVVPRVTYAPLRPGDPKRSALSPRKAERELDWRAQVPLVEGLRLTLRWLKDNPKYL